MLRQLEEAMRGVFAGRDPGVPEAGRLVWQWFWDISPTRVKPLAGPEPISHADIEAYGRSSGWPLRPEDVQAIRHLDAIFLKLQRERQGRSGDVRKLPPTSKSAVTADLFDAVFD